MAAKARGLDPTLAAIASLAPEQAPPDGDALEYTEAGIDESLEESFPASDPPSWAGMLRTGKPRRRPA